MIGALLLVAAVAILGGTAVAGVRVYGSTAPRALASVLFVAGWLLALAAILREAWRTGQFPLSNMAEYLLVLGWAVLSLHLLLWFWLRLDAAALVLPPIAALAALAASSLGAAGESSQVDVRPRAWFVLHTSLSTLGMAMLCVALAMNVIYLAQEGSLKARRTLRWLEPLPSLERCDQIGLRALWVGFVLLSLGIATGMIVNARVHAEFWSAGVKQTAPLLAWLVFAGTLAARVLLGFRGRKSAYWTIAGCALGLLTVIGMSF
ncbi:MAG TPA: cytochrome c biogenesis protein CcsA [Candidatus Polarisedimenticolaceae bacterium]|nr:cytochrome c biogenesis protein CcsA [Candidatus Polarisedimenticolaceae bacterium]